MSNMPNGAMDTGEWLAAWRDAALAAIPRVLDEQCPKEKRTLKGRQGTLTKIVRGVAAYAFAKSEDHGIDYRRLRLSRRLIAEICGVSQRVAIEYIDHHLADYIELVNPDAARTKGRTSASKFSRECSEWRLVLPSPQVTVVDNVASMDDVDDRPRTPIDGHPYDNPSHDIWSGRGDNQLNTWSALHVSEERTVAHLVAMTGQSTDSVARHVKRLVERGLAEVVSAERPRTYIRVEPAYTSTDYDVLGDSFSARSRKHERHEEQRQAWTSKMTTWTTDHYGEASEVDGQVVIAQVPTVDVDTGEIMASTNPQVGAK